MGEGSKVLGLRGNTMKRAGTGGKKWWAGGVSFQTVGNGGKTAGVRGKKDER